MSTNNESPEYLVEVRPTDPPRPFGLQLKSDVARGDYTEGVPANLRPISTAPRDGTFIILLGPSGYTSTAWRAEVGHWEPESNAWRNHAHDSVTEGGGEPTHWMPLPASA